MKNIPIKSLSVLLCTVIVSWSCGVFANAPLFIGVLESFNNKQWSEQTGKDSLNPRARIIFFKDKGQWQTIKSKFTDFEELTSSAKNYPNQVNWYVINDKNILGELVTKQYTPKLYRDAGVQEIVGNLPDKFQLPPTKNLQFPMMKMDHRPLIMISKDKLSYNVKGSDGWMSSKPTSNEMNQILKELPGKVLSGKKTYNINDVKVLESYRSSHGGLVLGVVVKDASKKTYNFQAPYWFYLTPSTIKFLGLGMNFVDMIDVDQDGKSEFIFMYSDPENVDQNLNGYILFYNDFNDAARFLWSNH